MNVAVKGDAEEQRQDDVDSEQSKQNVEEPAKTNDIGEQESTKNDEEGNIVAKLSNLTISPFDCDICGAKYKVAWTLKAHKVKKHNMKVTCEGCGEMFIDEALLNSHISQKHLKCEHCGINVVDLKSLKRHVMLHQVPVCKHCKEVFHNFDDLETHLKGHLTCEVCGKIFESIKQLHRHLKIHE